MKWRIAVVDHRNYIISLAGVLYGKLFSLNLRMYDIWLNVLPRPAISEYNATDDGGIYMTIDMKLTAVYLKVSEGYIGFVEELPGANTQGETLKEAKANLEEAINLVLEANRTLSEESLHGQEVIRETISVSAV